MVNFVLLLVFLTLPQKVVVRFFYSPDCGHCLDILLEDIPILQKNYNFQFKKYDLNILENYALLEKMEENVEEIGDDLPVIFVGDSALYGPDEAREKLEATIKDFLEDTLPAVEDTAKPIVDSVVPEHSNINLYYFYQPGCRECDRIDMLLNGFQKYYTQLKVYKRDIFVDSNKIFYEALAAYINVPESKRLTTPALFIGEDYLIKEDITSERLGAAIKKNRLESPRFDTLTLVLGEEHILERFSRFSIMGILFAGLLDGVNPCAFATLIFFVSYLVFIERRRRDIIVMAGFFIVAVFIAYLAIGLGAYNVLKYLVGFTFVAKIIFFTFGVFAIILGILSLRDYSLAKRGETSKMILQLPLSIKQRIHKDIKEKTAIGGLIVGSLLAGFFISFLEFGCTGQVYLPTITFMTSKAGFALKPLFALVAYNLMFIMPLIVIAFLSTIFTTKKVAQSLETRVPIIKLFTAMLFFALGILLIVSA